MHETLTRIEWWLQAHAPAIAAQLEPGASAAEIDALERRTGYELPSSYRALYLCHACWGDTFGLQHLPLRQVDEDWMSWRDVEAYMKEAEPDFFYGQSSEPPQAILGQYAAPGWIPLLQTFGSDYIGLDMNPGSAGQVGQVITFGRDTELKFVLAHSLDGFLTEYLERLEAGRVRLTLLQDQQPPLWTLRLTDEKGYCEPGSWSLNQYPGFGTLPARLRGRR